MLHWIRSQLRAFGLDETKIRQTELASEEALVNIIRHGYQEKAGKIEIALDEKKGQMEVVIRDYGPAFNPLEKELNFNPHATLEERDIGGLGILFIRECMDEVRYARENDANVLTLIKKLAS